MKSAPPATAPPVSERDFSAVPSLSEASAPLLRFRDLRKAFGGQTVLDGISGEIRPGEVILLRGENGTGKTTLLNILSGCLEPDGGAIEILGTDGSPAESFRFPQAWHRNLNPFQHFTPERVARLGITRTWQDIRLIPSLDLADNIAVATCSSDDSLASCAFAVSCCAGSRATSNLLLDAIFSVVTLTEDEHASTVVVAASRVFSRVVGVKL